MFEVDVQGEQVVTGMVMKSPLTVHATFSSTNHHHSTPNHIFDCKTSLFFVLELFVSIHKGFYNAQLATLDYCKTDAFLQLTFNKMDIVLKIHKVLLWLKDFCDADGSDNNVQTLCI